MNQETKYHENLGKAIKRIKYMESNGIEIMKRSIQRREIAVVLAWVIIGLLPFAAYGIYKIIHYNYTVNYVSKTIL